MTQDMLSLGFDRIIEQLQEMAVSRSARRILADTEPILNESLCCARMEETTAARRVMENMGTPPLTETENTRAGLAAALQGGMLSPADLCSAARFCAATCRERPRTVPPSLPGTQSCRSWISWRRTSAVPSGRTPCWTTPPRPCGTCAAGGNIRSRESVKN